MVVVGLAEDHSAVRDGRFPFSKYSRTFLYIAGHLLPPTRAAQKSVRFLIGPNGRGREKLRAELNSWL